MPHARTLTVLLPVLVLLPALAGAQDEAGFHWSPELRSGLAWQDYAGDDIDESMLAHVLELRIDGRHPAGWRLGLDLISSDNLYLGSRRAQAEASFLGERGELSLRGSLEDYRAGGLSDPLLYFDPDSLESEAAESADYLLSTGTAALGWRGSSWDARVNFGAKRLDYEAESEILSDLEEIGATGRLELMLPALLRAELELGARALRYPRRPGSDRDTRRIAGRLARDLPAGEVSLVVELEDHDPLQPDAVAYYERPRGQEWILAAEALYFRARSDWLATLRLGRERWDEGEGLYFRSGEGAELELNAGLRLGDRPETEAPRIELFLLASRFEPDALAADDALARGRERRIEANARLSLSRRACFPVALFLAAEQLNLESDSEDRYTLLQQGLELGWQLRSDLLLSGELVLDHYGSRYGDALAGEDDSESERELGGGLEARWTRGPWEWRLGLRRQVYTSFLDLGGDSRDWEGGLWIRWRP